MRLISTADLTLHTFPDDAIPRYSILSHTWGDKEVLFHEMLSPTHEIRGRAGYKKIQKCAEISREVWDCDFTWVDTCCIDKTSSSELSESINSMYAWYRDSHICFAYLEDFYGENIDQLARGITFKPTRWFTRGWTLQEFIAPEEVIFFSASWKRIGNKQWHLQVLESITGIDQSILRRGDLQNVSVAEKMKWVRNRQTTKKEDLAYCMLGIFDVNMPLLYGEGEKAFTRLQEEIMRNSDDVTIFLWKSLDKHPHAYRGALARHPIEFALSTAPKAPMHVLDEPYRMTNKGLQITTPLTELDRVASEHIAFLAEDPHSSSLFLLSLDQHDQYQRVVTHHVVLRKIKLTQHHYVRAYPGFQFIAPRKALGMATQRSRPGEKTITVIGRLSLSDVDLILPCRGFKITGVTYTIPEVTYAHIKDYINKPIRTVAREVESQLVKTTSSADRSILEALYHSRYVGNNYTYGKNVSKHILLRYEQKHGKLHLFVFGDLRTTAFEIGDAVSIDTLLQAARERRYPSGPTPPCFHSPPNPKLDFFAGTVDMRQKTEIEGDVGTDKFTAKFSWTISDGVFLDVHIDHAPHIKKR